MTNRMLNNPRASAAGHPGCRNGSLGAPDRLDAIGVTAGCGGCPVAAQRTPGGCGGTMVSAGGGWKKRVRETASRWQR